MTPELSVIIPSFNTAGYIADAVLSIVQDVPQAEIIVVDDASTDKTLERLDRLDLPNLIVIPLLENSPGGAGYASNIGLDRASGKYIAFVDSDDFFCVGYLANLLRQIKSATADICIASYTLLDTLTHVTEPGFDEVVWRKLMSSKKSKAGSLEKGEYLTLSPEPWRKIYRSRLFQNPRVRFPVNGWFNEDYPFHWFTGLEETKGICYVNIDNYFHRLRRFGQTTSGFDERIFCVFDHTDLIINFMNSASCYAGFTGYLLNWLLITMWKIRFLEVGVEEYYLRYRNLILSFDQNAVAQFKQVALPKHWHAYRAILASNCVSELFEFLAWEPET